MQTRLYLETRVSNSADFPDNSHLSAYLENFDICPSKGRELFKKSLKSIQLSTSFQ